MIYTTNFSNIRKLPKDIVPISICGKAPDWYKGIQYKKLAPKYNFFMEWKKNQDNNFYIEHFNKEVLELLNPNQVFLELDQLSNDREFALICYESKPKDDMQLEDIIKDMKYFCHRHLVAEWFRDYGFDIIEF